MYDAFGIKFVRRDENRDQLSVTEHSRHFVHRMSSNLAEQKRSTQTFRVAFVTNCFDVTVAVDDGFRQVFLCRHIVKPEYALYLDRGHPPPSRMDLCL